MAAPFTEQSHGFSLFEIGAETLQLIMFQFERNCDAVPILVKPKDTLILKKDGYTEWHCIRGQPHLLQHNLSFIVISEESSDKFVDVKTFYSG